VTRPFSVEDIDRALAHADAIAVDDQALLILLRGQLLDVPIGPGYLVEQLGVSEDEERDIFARLAEDDLVGRIYADS
jgi:hypothetical protein